MVDTVPIEAIWVCGAKDISAEMGQAKPDFRSWLAVPTTVLCRSQDVYDWFIEARETVEARRHEPLIVRAAFTPNQIAIERDRAIQQSEARFIHLRTAPFLYDPLAIALLGKELTARSPELASADVVFKAGPVFSLTAGWLLRRHHCRAIDSDLPARPQTMTETFASTELLRRNRHALAAIPACDHWGRLLVEYLRADAAADLHVPLLIGSALRRKRLGGKALGVGPIALNALMANLPVVSPELLPAHPHELPDQMFLPDGQFLVNACLTLSLLKDFEPPVARYVEACVAEQVAPRIPALRERMAGDDYFATVVMGQIADALDLQVFDGTDHQIEDCVEILRQALTREALLGSARMISRLLAVVLNDKQPIEASAIQPFGPLEDPVALLRRVDQLEHQMRFWRAECSRQSELVTKERSRVRAEKVAHAKLKAEMRLLRSVSRSKTAEPSS